MLLNFAIQDIGFVWNQEETKTLWCDVVHARRRINEHGRL